MKKGFTLIEVVVAAAIIGILVAAIGSLNLFTGRLERSVRERDGSFNIAKGLGEMFRAEELEGSRYNSGAFYKYISSIEDIENLEVFYDASDGSYTGQSLFNRWRSEDYVAVLEAVRVQSPGSPELKILRIRVESNSQRGNAVLLTQSR